MRKGLSQEKLAHEAEMERNYISLLELGKNSVSIKKIFKLAGALGISVAEFMSLVENHAGGDLAVDSLPASSPRN